MSASVLKNFFRLSVLSYPSQQDTSLVMTEFLSSSDPKKGQEVITNQTEKKFNKKTA
jgi:hypothetical protein